MTPQTAPASALQTAIGIARALVGGDAGTALGHFGPGARLLTADGTEVSGRGAIGAVLTQLTAPAQRLEILPSRTLVAGDVALCTESWRLISAAAVKSYERASTATLVLQRSDEHWRILIAALRSRPEGIVDV